MINWFWKHKNLLHRLPVLMALLTGLMFTAMPAGKSYAAGKSFSVTQLQKDHKSATGQELPVFEPGCTALAQVAPVQFFFLQQVPIPAFTPLVEIVNLAPASMPRPINRLHRTLFTQIISPNAP